MAACKVLASFSYYIDDLIKTDCIEGTVVDVPTSRVDQLTGLGYVEPLDAE